VRQLWLILLLGFVSLGVSAQDLDSERSFEEHFQWNRIEGASPRLLKCRVSKSGDLQCVADLPLKNVKCDAFHFSKKTPVRAVVRNRAFTCDGTKLDRDSLLSQWEIHVLATDGSQSSWRVDSADRLQMKRLFEAELESLDFIESQRNFYLSLGSITSMEDPMNDRLLMTGVKARYGSSSFVLGVQVMQALSLIPEKRTDWLMNTDFVISSRKGGMGWLAGLEFGQKKWGFESVSTQCLMVRYRWNPGSWRSQVSGGHCWYPNAGVNWAPLGELRLGKLFWKHMLLEASTQAVYRTAATQFPDSGGLELRAQLGVSFELFPE